MENCVFCKIIKGEIPSYKIYEDEKFFAFLDIRPVNPGHMDIIPKEHYGYIFDLPENLYQGIFELAKKISIPLKLATGAKRIGIAVEGFGVDHAHVHLVPLHNSYELDPHRAKKASEEELELIQKRIIEKL